MTGNINEENLDKLKSLFKYKDGNYYTNDWEYMIVLPKPGDIKARLYHHSEVDGSVWFIKRLASIEDLRAVYYAIENEELQ